MDKIIKLRKEGDQKYTSSILDEKLLHGLLVSRRLLFLLNYKVKTVTTCHIYFGHQEKLLPVSITTKDHETGNSSGKNFILC